jgi:hypothetical protein
MEELFVRAMEVTANTHNLTRVNVEFILGIVVDLRVPAVPAVCSAECCAVSHK